MQKKPGSIPFLLMLASSGIVLIFHGYLGSYTRLLADDFCSVYFAQRLGMLRYVWYWYLTWGGRYSAIAFDWFIYPIGAAGVRFIPGLVLLVWLATTVMVVWLFLKREYSERVGLPIALSAGSLTLFVVLLMGPSVPQILYWWNGMRTYTLPLILLVVYVSVLMLFQKLTAGRHLRTMYVVGFLFMVGLGGFNETFTAILLALFLLILAAYVLARQRHFFDPTFRFLLAGLLGIIISLIIMLSSPGIEHRQASFPPPPGLPDMLKIAFTGYVRYLRDLLSAPQKIAGLSGGVLVAGWLGARSERGAIPGKWLAPLLLAVGILLSYAVILPAVYAMSEPPAPRTMIISSFILVFSLFLAGFLTGKRLQTGFDRYPRTGHTLFVFATVLILFSAAWTVAELFNSRSVYVDYARQWDQADVQIVQARSRGDASVTIPAVPNWAGLELPNDNPKHWVNACYTLYYEIQVFGETGEGQ
ncbi:MAG: DUF6056 family protein [Chloroflexota bacterium]